MYVCLSGRYHPTLTSITCFIPNLVNVKCLCFLGVFFNYHKQYVNNICCMCILSKWLSNEMVSGHQDNSSWLVCIMKYCTHLWNYVQRTWGQIFIMKFCLYINNISQMNTKTFCSAQGGYHISYMTILNSRMLSWSFPSWRGAYQWKWYTGIGQEHFNYSCTSKTQSFKIIKSWLDVRCLVEQEHIVRYTVFKGGELADLKFFI